MRVALPVLLLAITCTGGVPHREARRDAGERAAFVIEPSASAAPSAAVSSAAPHEDESRGPSLEERKAAVTDALGGRAPRAWGQSIAGVLTRFETDTPRVVLTLDACGGPGGNAYDEALVEYLRSERVAATLFVTRRWIDANPDVARDLAEDPLFEIENHGDRHKPCSVNGRSAYDIRGTRSVADAAEEIADGARAIEALTGKRPRFFRPGTAYFDDVCVEVVTGMGERPMGYSVVGDAGGGFGRREVARQVGEAPSGSVILVHMNKPRSATAEGLMDAIPRLRARGVELVRLDQVELR